VKAGLPVSVYIDNSQGLFPTRELPELIDPRVTQSPDSASEREAQADYRIDGGCVEEAAGHTVRHF
jgi:hypothetical protein